MIQEPHIAPIVDLATDEHRPGLFNAVTADCSGRELEGI
jgi:hypothetical protein